MRKIGVFIFCLFSLGCSFAQSSLKINDYHCMKTTVNYFMNGEKQRGLFFIISHKDTANPSIIYSSLYLLSKEMHNTLLSNDFVGLYDLKISRQSTYLSVLMVSEGHPWIEIVNTQSLIDQKKYNPIQMIQPYPGNVYELRWLDDNRLLIESDINLCAKNDHLTLGEKDMFEKSQRFVYNVQTNKFMKVKR